MYVCGPLLPEGLSFTVTCDGIYGSEGPGCCLPVCSVTLEQLLTLVACARTMSLSPLQRVCAKSLMTLILEKVVESGSEPRAAILGSPSASRGNCVQKQGVADLGVKGIYLESQAWDLATNVPVTGEGDLMEPAVHFFPVRDCCPHRAVSVPLPWLLNISAILTTLGKGGLFLDVTPLPCISPAPFCNGFPAVLLDKCSRPVGISDWPGVTHESTDLLGSDPCKADFLGPNALEPESGPFRKPQPPPTTNVTSTV